ncbi:MAG: GNAT family N-acetyltransferase [Lachnospiraceae bacterium]|nr:GNAT family N-acetyltransferase [Lachnospiraceae bacterium]
MSVAWRTFLRFEAEDYTQEGIESFREFITNPGIHKMFLVGEYIVYAAFYKGEMIGIISLRNQCHISLLFVEAKYHLNGVGRRLMEAMKGYEEHRKGRKLTVNSSPYAVGFYHKIGFVDTDLEQQKDGIRYTPMVWEW